MSVKKRGLGRGLEALLGADAAPGLAPAGEVRALPIEMIQKGRYQPRLDLRPEALEDLAQSIRVQGLVQPIVVRPLGGGQRYELIAGERRWRASQLAGLHEIPAIVRDVTDGVALSIALIENIQREDLNPLEQATAFSRLVNEFSMTHQEVADAVGRSRAAVSNLLRLLELQEEVKRKLEAGDLEMGHARALLALEGRAQIEAAQRVVAQRLSVRESERLVRRLQEAKPAGEQPPKDPNIAALEQQISERLGAKTSVRHDGHGRGSVVIYYTSLDELDGILNHIK
ncbi:MAG: putative chromosome-partitioning protein ParB [Chromatiales bacterium USCg_Taylor]|nr:MAG: putative chromosome-partitioning protein ParB [Chromatiales bacterium USCg_Taylor]